MQEKDLIKLNKICANENIILVSLKTNGLFGILRSYSPEHTSIYRMNKIIMNSIICPTYY